MGLSSCGLKNSFVPSTDKGLRMKKHMLRFLVLVSAFTALAAQFSVRAQLPMAQGGTADREQSESDRDLEERIANMRYLATLADNGRNRKKDPKLALKELQEDFTQLQILNKDLVLKTAKTQAPDLSFVSKSASEINRRAARLLSNLALPESGTGPLRSQSGEISDSIRLKASITKLGWLIYNFKKNPIFQEVGVIEASSAVKARSDLEAIIDLSLHIKKGSEQLRNSDKK